MITLKGIVESVVSRDREKILDLLTKGLDEGIDPILLANEGVTKGLRELGDLFGKEKIYLPELIYGAEIVKEGLNILKPHLISRVQMQKEGQNREVEKKKFVLGTVEGDVHDLGKNIVHLIFDVSGYDVIDLGVDVPTDKFVAEVKKHKPDLLGLSALMTTTMLMQREVIEALKRAGERENVKVMIGGACITEKWHNEIGSDAFATNVMEGLAKAKVLLSKGGK